MAGPDRKYTVLTTDLTVVEPIIPSRAGLENFKARDEFYHHLKWIKNKAGSLRRCFRRISMAGTKPLPGRGSGPTAGDPSASRDCIFMKTGKYRSIGGWSCKGWLGQ